MKRKVLMRKTEPEEPPQERHAPALERQLLRTSVLSMSSHRRACACCGRSPLIGERIQVFAARHGRERPLCDLCAPDAGEPIRKERIWPAERSLTIRPAA